MRQERRTRQIPHCLVLLVQLDLSVLQQHSPAATIATTSGTSSSSLPPTQSAGNRPSSATETTADAAATPAAVDYNPRCFTDVYTLISAGLDNRVLQWDLAQEPSVLNSVHAGDGGLELSVVTYLQNWAILATGEKLHSLIWWSG